MGVLGNPDHERFCQTAHKRIWAGEKHVAAYYGAYVEAIWEGEGEPGAKAIAANVRRLRNRKEIKARMVELADFAAKLAGIDSAWGMVRLKGFVDSNLDDYLSKPDANGTRFFDLTDVPRDKIGLLSELHIEDETEIGKGEDDDGRRIRKIKLKLPDRVQALALMAKIGGWEKPAKMALTDPTGEKDRLAELLAEIDGKSRGLVSE